MPRAAPTTVVEQRITLGQFERQALLRAGREARTGLGLSIGASMIGRVAVPLAIASGAAAIALGLAGMGLGQNLDKEKIEAITIGTPDVKRTRMDGTEQTIPNIAYGIPVIGPLFGTGMRIGEKSAETVSGFFAAIEDFEARFKQNLADTVADVTGGGGGGSSSGGGGGGF